MSDADSGFLSRWSRRKVQARSTTADAVPERAPDATTALPTASALTTASASATAVAGSARAPAEPALPPAPRHPDPPSTAAAPPPAADPPPTLDDVATLTPASDFSRYVARDVDPGVRHAALRKLFADPHFNVMDGLDVYIDDYSQPDPLPRAMLRQMVQARALGLFDAEEPPQEAAADARVIPSAAEAAQAPMPAADPAARAAAARMAGPVAEPIAEPIAEPAAAPTAGATVGATVGAIAGPTDEDPDLQLQPHDAAGCAGPGPGAGEDARRQR